MTLRLRLLLGYGYLVVLLLLSTGSAMLGFLHLSETVDVILEENFASVRSAMAMMEALERQDSATLAALIEKRSDVAEMGDYEEAFLVALTAAENNVTEGRESEVLATVREDFEDYRRARRELLAAQPERPLRAYNVEVFPAFSRVKDGVFELLEINHGAMIEADRATRESALRNGAWLGLLVTVALVSLVFLSRALQSYVLVPLERLRRGMGDVAGGHLDRRLSERDDGELGAIAGRFNALLDRLQQAESRLEGRMRQERRLVLALARLAGPEAVIYDLSGRRLAGEGELAELLGSHLTGPLMDWVDERHAALEEGPPEGEPPVGELEVEGRRVSVRLLSAGPGRPVGWLVRNAD